MPRMVRNVGICSIILLILFSSGYELRVSNYNSYSQEDVHENSLESIADQTGISGGIAQIDTGKAPTYIEIDRSVFSGFVYVLNTYSDYVSVIDPTTNKVIKNIHVGESPSYMYADLTDSEQEIYVANSLSNTVSVIDPTTNTLIKNIHVGESPNHIHGSTFVDHIYVANSYSYSNTVSVIDPTTNNVVKNITVGDGPTHIEAGPYLHNSPPYYIYVANYFSSSISVIDPTTNNVVKNITALEFPSYLFHYEGYIYAINGGTDSNTVSVIDPTTNNVVKNITVGLLPQYIVDHDSAIYVANSGSNTVSVIDPNTNTVVKNIAVGEFPVYMSGMSTAAFSNEIYVANSGSNTVSVIDPTTNTVQKNIKVGESSESHNRHINNEYYPSIYVANPGSDSISVIDGITDEVVAGVTFEVSPFRGGDIICNKGDNTNSLDLDAPIDRYLYVSTGSKCLAKPSKGFEFGSWVEVLEDNSTRTINATSGSPLTAFLDAVNLKPDDPAATLTVNRFGNFTAYFRALPPAIPSEYLIPLYGIVISTVVGLSIPSIISWRKTKKQTSRLNSYHQEMTSLYDDGKLDEKDTEHLNNVNKNVINAYSEGKINNEQYTNLRNEISALYEEIYRKRIDSIRDSSDEDANPKVVMEKIHEDIRDSYSKGKISELHYNLLNERLQR